MNKIILGFIFVLLLSGVGCTDEIETSLDISGNWIVMESYIFSTPIGTTMRFENEVVYINDNLIDRYKIENNQILIYDGIDIGFSVWYDILEYNNNILVLYQTDETKTIILTN